MSSASAQTFPEAQNSRSTRVKFGLNSLPPWQRRYVERVACLSAGLAKIAPQPADKYDKLFLRFLFGQRDAFQQLFADLNPWLIAMATCIAHLRHSDAEEAAQQTWLKVLEWRDPGTGFMTRLCACLRTQLLEYASKRIRGYIGWYVTNYVMPFHDDPSECLLKKEQEEESLSVLNDVISALSPRDTDIVRSVFIEDMSYEQSARHLNISKSTVQRAIDNIKDKVVAHLHER